MIKILLLLFLVPIAIAVILRLILYRTPKPIEGVSTLMTTEKMCQLILPKETTIREGKSNHYQGETLTVKSPALKSKELGPQAELYPTLGLVLLSKGKDKWVKQHQSIKLFSQIVPPLGLLICVFAVLAKSLIPSHAIIAFVGVLGLCTANNLYLTWIRHQALSTVAKALERTSLYVRREHYETLQSQLHARKFEYLLPPLVQWLFPK